MALTGSHCTLEKVMPQLKKIQEEGGTVTAIISTAVDKVDSRFGEASYWKKRLKEITGKEIIRTVQEAEPVGPEKIFDVIVIAPCTGNTLA
ncbi:flavoprotein, partial [Escherichia coli]